MIGAGSPTAPLTPTAARDLVARALDPLALDGRRVLVIIPDATRTAQLPLFFALLSDLLAPRAAALDYLIALGTHPPMSGEAIDRLVGMPTAERARRYPNVHIHNHHWHDPAALKTIGTISRDETAQLTGGLLATEVPVTLNRLIDEYDQLIICGPVYPHEVAGFSGGAKYFFPGIAGPEIIDFTHWVGALATSLQTIGIKDTLVRRIIHRAAAFVTRPTLCLAAVLHDDTLYGLFIGSYLDAFDAATELSGALNIITVPQAFRRVLSLPSTRYDDLWTAAKAMYKTEPAVAAGGEIIIYAPHLSEVSYTHGALIDQVGYHVRDYFLAQWERFKHVPGSILAHSTHVKGSGSYDATHQIEHPRIQVTLATGIPEERCRRINLGYADYRAIDPETWAHREAEGLLLVRHAGEQLYRASD
ncbi:MAG TPA: lactate racemase domain-containing protein, partial [Ktedonobacterales bacterium]|nr:lactate racemase domain-containing protein [Ktedonobacterales bacterium]